MAGGEVAAGAENIESQAPQSVSSGNEQADAAIIALKEKALASLTHPTIQELAEAEYHELMEAVNGHDEVLSGVDGPRKEFNEDMKALQKIDSKFNKVDVPGGDTQSGLDNMISFISSLPGEEQEEIYAIFNESSPRALKKYFKKNGFINSETFEAFSKEFGVDLSHAGNNLKKVIVSENQLDKESNERSLVTFEAHKEIAVDISKTIGVDKKLVEILSIFDKEGVIHTDISSEKYDELKEYFEELSDNPVAFAETLNSLGGKDSELYQKVKTVVLSRSPSLKKDFENYEGEYVSPLPDFKNDLSKELTIEMNKDVIGDADIAEEYDYSKNPPSRSIKLEGSEYSMESNLPVGDLYPATVEYTEVSQEIEPKLQTIDAALKFIEGLTGSEDLGEVKEILKTMIPYTVRQALGVNVDSYNSVQEIKMSLSGVLGQKKRELEEELDLAREKYQDSLDDLREVYKETLREQQEKQRDILDLLKRTGFDLIPQGFTDRIIAEINFRKNIDLGNDIRVNSDMDIANGEFGVNLAGENTIREQEGFIRLINKMVTGESEGEKALIAEPSSFISQKMIVDPRSMREILNKEDGIIGAGGGLDMNQVYKNLWNKEVTSFDLDEPK